MNTISSEWSRLLKIWPLRYLSETKEDTTDIVTWAPVRGHWPRPLVLLLVCDGGEHGAAGQSSCVTHKAQQMPAAILQRNLTENSVWPGVLSLAPELSLASVLSLAPGEAWGLSSQGDTSAFGPGALKLGGLGSAWSTHFLILLWCDEGIHLGHGPKWPPWNWTFKQAEWSNPF